MPGPPPEPSATDLARRVLGAVLRYKWAVLLVTVLGTAAGHFASRFFPPVYRAQGTVWIQTTGGEPARAGPIRAERLLGSSAWIDLLKSYVVLEGVVRQRGLYISPEDIADTALFRDFHIAAQFTPGQYTLVTSTTGYELRLGDVRVESGRLGDSIGLSAGLLWRPEARALQGPRTIVFHVTPPREAAEALATGMIVRVDPAGSFLRIEVTGRSPTGLAGTVNDVLDRFVEVAADLKREKLTQLTRILADQLESARNHLRGAEWTLETFRVRTITLPTDRSAAQAGAQPGGPAFTSFFDMNVRREQLRHDREAIERALVDASDAGVSADAFNVIGEVQASTELRGALLELTTKLADLRALRYKYSDQHPTVVRQAAAVDSLSRQTVPMLARRLVQQISAREAELSARVTSASANLQQIPPRVMEEGRLTRERGIAEAIYTQLQQRYDEARLAEASTIPDVRILDRPAVPRRPLRDLSMKLLMLGFVGGLACAIGGAMLVERMDSRLRYPEQVTAGMGLTILGAVPHVRKNGKSKTDTRQVLEALRSVRLNLIHAYGAAGPLVVTITSPGSGDGKSFLSSNLALCCADNGARTLLVDADVRRGRLHALMNVTRKPGLTDFLAGEATREQIIHQTSYPFLSMIACGTRRRNGPELLGSPAMSQLMATLRSSYEVILVDSPPLGAGVDPFVLGTLTGNIMLVLRTGVTDREFAEVKLDMLDRLPLRVLGAVLNDVPAGAAYGYYAYYSYLPGYEAADERDAEPARLPGESSS